MNVHAIGTDIVLQALVQWQCSVCFGRLANARHGDSSRKKHTDVEGHGGGGRKMLVEIEMFQRNLKTFAWSSLEPPSKYNSRAPPSLDEQTCLNV